ncbi:MAG: Wzz/FepE/Etk N-terminal domain-containing protein [Balneolaceae bacterium]|nr:Wzz/FepE/Etk N-terminal domain-containing protein [Balneolaceae bacterium]
MSDYNKNEPDRPEEGSIEKKGKKQLEKSSLKEEYRLIPVSEEGYQDREDEVFIDLVGIAKDLWVNKGTILSSVIIVFALGIIIYLGSNPMYYSEAQLMPQSTSNQSQLGQLFQQYGNFFGIQREAEENDIQVTMYPHIVESLNFQIELMQHEVYFSTLDSTLTVFDYFNEYYRPSLVDRTVDFIWNYTIALPVTIWDGTRSFFSKETSERPEIDFSQFDEFDAPKQLDNRIRKVSTTAGELITISREPQTGFVNIGVSLPDPQASTEMVMLVKELLQEYVTDFRTEKAINNLEFIEEQYEEAKQLFQIRQDSLAAFQDRNVNLNLQSVAVVEQRLQSEYDLAFSLYNTLARRLQEAKIQVQEETPVFRVHEPAVIPGSPSEPDPLRILGGSLFAGLFLGIVMIYLRRWVSYFWNEFKNKDPKPYLS